MRPDDEVESPASMRRRAAALRDCAARAKRIAGSLGPYLDAAVATATAEKLWQGPFAQQSTARLQAERGKLRAMAQDLVASAHAWQAEAQRLEDDAAAVERAQAATTAAGSG
jgi:prophage DNA circulation protein